VTGQTSGCTLDLMFISSQGVIAAAPATSVTMTDDCRQDDSVVVFNDEMTKSRHRQRLVIDRPVFDQSSFDRTFGESDEDNPKLASAAACTSASLHRLQQRLKRTCGCDNDVGTRLQRDPGRGSSVRRAIGRKVLSFVPFVKHLRDYCWRQWLINDILSGISVGVVHVPQVIDELSLRIQLLWLHYITLCSKLINQ
jgi:hypothetical protein